MRRSALVVALVVLLGVPATAVGPASAAPTHAGTTIAIQVQPNGDAIWTVSAQYNLSDQNDTAAFERLRSEYEAGGADVGPSADLFRQAASQVAEQTDREMAVTEVSRSSSIEVQNETSVGVLRLSFRWTNFATVSGDAISVGSAFSGGWFGDLAEGQTLRIEPPSGYTVQTARPSTDIVGGALQWEGPQAFDPGEPSIAFTPPVTPTPPTTTPPPQGIQWTYPAAAFGGLIVLALVLLAWRGGYLGGGTTTTEADEPPPGGGVESESQAETGEPPADGETADETEAGTAAGDDAELLSDEERVEHLLREHGGRMKQARIVEETRWSNAKVSQLLSSMAEEGRVEKLRIGRENLISLPGYDESE